MAYPERLAGNRVHLDADNDVEACRMVVLLGGSTFLPVLLSWNHLSWYIAGAVADPAAQSLGLELVTQRLRV